MYRIAGQTFVYIYVAYSRPNDWTDWVEIFFGHSWVAGDVLG